MYMEGAEAFFLCERRPTAADSKRDARAAQEKWADRMSG
jgi:hypothetical protein